MTLVTLSSVIKRPLTEHVFRLVRSGTLLSRLARVRNFSNSVIAYCFTLFEADSDNFLVYICKRRSAHDHFLTLISVRSALITWTTIRSSSYIKLTCRAHFFKLLDISSKQTRELLDTISSFTDIMGNSSSHSVRGNVQYKLTCS